MQNRVASESRQMKQKVGDVKRKNKHRITRMSDGKLMETQTANYFSDIYPIDCAVLSANA